MKWGRKTAPPGTAPKQKAAPAPDAGVDGGAARAPIGADSSGAGRGAEVYPLTKKGEWSFTQSVIGGEASTGDYRVLRASFLDDDTWYLSPLYLEAFAQSVLADEAATDMMRDLASLAFHRAGKLVPGAADEYARLSADASRSKEATALRDELDQAWSKAFAPPVEAVEEVDEVDEVIEVAEEEPEEDRSMLLVVAGVLVVVALLGFGAILKKRR